MPRDVRRWASRGLAVITAAALCLAGLPVLAVDALPFGPATVGTVERELRGFTPAGPADAAGRITTHPLDAPIDFTLVGFRLPPGLQVEARTSDPAGRWSPWYAAEPLGDASGPDHLAFAATHADDDVFTEPLWLGEARRLQLRVRGGVPSAVRAIVIDSAGLSSSRTQRLLDQLRPGTHAAQASTVPGEVRSRAAWGADESWMTWTPRATASLELAIVHHTAGGNSYTPEQGAAVVRGIYHYHARTLGWGDIGYNLLVDRYGQVYEGRAGGLDRAIVAGHAAGFNARTFGIAVIGDFEDNPPPAVAEDAVARMLAWKLAHHGIDPSASVSYTTAGNGRFPAGTTLTLPTIVGHRDTGWTTCPGAAFSGRMDHLRALVATLAPPPLAGFVPLVPARVLDTRDAVHGELSSKVGHRTTASTRIAGVAGVPPDAVAVALNITAVHPTRDSYLTISPSGVARPLVSSINAPAGALVNNLVLAAPGADGSVDLYNHNGEVDVVLDVMGYLPSMSAYRPLPPSRILDTRDGTGDVGSRIGRRQTVRTTVAGRAGVPADARVVAVNVTAVAGTHPTYLTIFPSGSTRPHASSLNVGAGQVVNNFVLAQLGADGALELYNHDGLVDVVLDVVGYLPPGSSYVPVRPARVLDTRDDTDGSLSDPIGRRRTVAAQIAGRGGVPADARSVAINLTAVDPTDESYLTVSPPGQPRPNASALNVSPGVVVGNFLIAELGADGSLALYNHEGDTDVVIDVVGYSR